MYTHVSKCKNDKINKEKIFNSFYKKKKKEADISNCKVPFLGSSGLSQKL
jgi:hypothetical protein